MRIVPIAVLSIALAAVVASASDAAFAAQPVAASPQNPLAEALERARAAAQARYAAGQTANPRPPGVQGKRLVGVGTGFFIAPDRVLTNFHVAGVCSAVTVGNNQEGAQIDAKLEAGDADLDLAALSTAPVADVTPARFKTDVGPDTGADLSIVGYPNHGLPVIVAELDKVSASYADLLAEERLYPFNGEVRRGNSGSPVLDNAGAVLGVVTAKIDTVAVYKNTRMVVNDDLGFAIANRVVLDFLRKNNVAFQPATSGAALSSDALLEKAHGFVRQIGCWK